MRSWIAIVLLLTIAGCPSKRDDRKAPLKTTCAHYGDSCEFAPGKLGVCIAPEGCTASSCLICQSQH
jgi:hypothetical protein